MRLIDADQLLQKLQKDPLFPLVEQYGISRVIEAAPTVDAVEVVRCSECKWHEDNFCSNFNVLGFGQDDYCSMRERREDETY